MSRVTIFSCSALPPSIASRSLPATVGLVCNADGECNDGGQSMFALRGGRTRCLPWILSEPRIDTRPCLISLSRERVITGSWTTSLFRLVFSLIHPRQYRLPTETSSMRGCYFEKPWNRVHQRRASPSPSPLPLRLPLLWARPADPFTSSVTLPTTRHPQQVIRRSQVRDHNHVPQSTKDSSRGRAAAVGQESGPGDGQDYVSVGWRGAQGGEAGKGSRRCTKNDGRHHGPVPAAIVETPRVWPSP